MSEEKTKPLTRLDVGSEVLRLLQAGVERMRVDRRDHRVIGDIESMLHGIAVQTAKDKVDAGKLTRDRR